MILLFDRCKFGVSLDADHVDYGVTNVLLRNLHPPAPFRHPFEISEFDGLPRGIPVESDLKSIVS